ncbi:hypothetical protein FGB62_193g053 [Gracilaria domingensis]|nr:hypothetical protein FGB62_193g053 [Gracilaria domingensis]
MSKFSVILILAGLMPLCSACPNYKTLVLTDKSGSAAGLQAVVDNFRASLGGIDNGNDAGPLEDGQRSINWDAGIVPFNMPNDFFNTQVTRGAIFQTKWNEFAVSNPAEAPPVDDRFSSLLPQSVSTQFRRFSLERLFTPVQSNEFTVWFQIPAGGESAVVSGFGAVFTDVDKENTTVLRFYDVDGCLIETVYIPAQNKGLSFGGAIVVDKYSKKTISAIAQVDITLGDIAIADVHYKSGDVVVADDFIYGEPV